MEASDETGEFVEVVELLHADAGDVEASRVSLEQSTARTISAEHISINQSAIRDISADTATMTQSASFVLKSSDIALHESAAGLVSGNQVDLFDTAVGLVRGPVTIGEGSARILIQIGPANPHLKPVLDAKSALGLGAGFGASLVLLSRLLRRLLGN